MKTITLNCVTEFGKWDSADFDVEVEITDEKYDRLVKAKEESESDDYTDWEGVKDIISELDAIAVKQATEDILSYDRESVQDYIDEDIENGYIKSEDEWSADSVYQIGIANIEL